MIKVEQQTNTITPGHKFVVFLNKEASDKKDLAQTVGRFDETRRAIAFLDGTPNGDKWKALMSGGFQIHLARDKDGNYYITDLIDNLSDIKPYTESSDLDDIEQQIDSRPELVYKEEKEFLEQDIDSAMDLNFTTNDLGFEHRVGLYNEEFSTYTLREDVKDFLEDFSFSIDENDEGVIANIDNSSINPRKLLLLVKLLKKQEQEDDEELREAIEAGRVQVDSLAEVKSLLRRLALAQKHDEIEESEDAEIELNQLLAQYREANPPARGIEQVEAKRDEILTKSKEVEQVQIHDEEAESLDEELKHDSAKAMDAMSILEASGIQIRGQQYGY
ncbi:TPA: hypothetical protein RQJ59_001788 [Vibrio vulnificus]|nr:hypothetical protein [Vibrio vulnificus]